MYFTVGWPKCLSFCCEDNAEIRSVFCNRDRSLFGILTQDSVNIWHSRPCIQIVSHRRSKKSIDDLGENSVAEWKQDSSMIVIATNRKHLIFLKVEINDSKESCLFTQCDSKLNSLKRESAELFTKDSIPRLTISESCVTELTSVISSFICIRDELMVCSCDGSIKRIRWDGTINADYCLRLPRIPFAVDQQLSKAAPLDEETAYISDLDYSPLLGGFSIVFADGRAAFLTGPSLLFEPNQIQGVWAQDIKNATCTTINHKFRLIAFGLANAQVAIYSIDEVTGALQVSHKLVLSSKDFPDAEKAAQAVKCLAWSPDGSTLVLAWEKGGISLWTVFGSLLMCTLNWMSSYDPCHWKFNVCSVEWSVEGYTLWMVSNYSSNNNTCDNNRYQNVIQLQFIKSALTVNPCMATQSRVFLQGDDRLYVNAGDAVIHMSDNSYQFNELNSSGIGNRGNLLGNKQWLVIQVPHSYIRENWPIRYACIDNEGKHVAVAGVTGLAHFSITLKKWKLFGNESQERDFVVTGGILWWREHIVVGCYNFLKGRDEVRLYTRQQKLDNSHVKVIKVPNQVLLLSRYNDHLAVFTADSQISIYNLEQARKNDNNIQIQKEQAIDISALIVHPACVVSLTITPLRAESVRNLSNLNKDLSIIINICGKLVMVQKDQTSQTNGMVPQPKYTSPIVLASCVENVWVSSRSIGSKLHLTEALWISCGSHGMRVWLPLLPRDGDKLHNFMSKRIMLPISNTICPLVVLFEDAVILGAENDSVFYSEDASSASAPSFPFQMVNRTSQVYLHHIFRQLLKRNLGLHAWEIARSCNSLPYFPHSLELLLHEVLEEEATSSEPIPDALLPRVVDFIREFPTFLQTVVQCARKIEIALWHYLFSIVGNPKTLFQECLERKKLETAASYLIILQNLESSNSSRHNATLLLDSALEHHKWELAKDIVRFLRAIDPHDLDSSPRTPNITPLSATSKYPTVGPYSPHPASPTNTNEEDLSSVFGLMQVINRNRSQSSGTVKLASPQTTENVSTVNCISKQLHGSVSRTVSDSHNIPRRRTSSGREFNDDFFFDGILTRHAKKLLSEGKLHDLGYFASHLDFPLVSFLRQERNSTARVDDFVYNLKKIHSEFKWPYPVPQLLFHQQKFTPASSRKSSANSIPRNVIDKTLQLHIDVSSNLKTFESDIGDSGYISNSANDIGFFQSKQHASSPIENKMLDAILSPHDKQDDQIVGIEMSDECSLWSDDPIMDNEDQTAWSNDNVSEDLDLMSQELASKGPSQSEVQLRYLFQFMLEAGCLEWALLISVVLRDIMAVIRTVNFARQLDQPEETISRLRNGLISLIKWSDSECLGYKPFSGTLQNQIQFLNKLLKTSPRVLKLQSQSSASSGEIPSLPNQAENSSNLRAKSSSEKSLIADEVLSSNDLINHEIIETNYDDKDKDDVVFDEHEVSEKSDENDNCVIS